MPSAVSARSAKQWFVSIDGRVESEILQKLVTIPKKERNCVRLRGSGASTIAATFSSAGPGKRRTSAETHTSHVSVASLRSAACAGRGSG